MVKKIKDLLRDNSRLWILLLIILLIPTFWRMLRPGIFSMHDLVHMIRLYDYDKCVQDLQIPCRWSPDVAFEYGQPVFNFYGQLAYTFGEFFRLIGFSYIDTLKSIFITSLILSAFSMFLLARQLWGSSWAALISALVYTYAPYRAVDIYVRGALPESFAFIFFPLITYLFNQYVKNRKSYSLIFFVVSYAGLILTHNLSALMYSLFLVIWAGYYFFKEKAWSIAPKFLLTAVGILGLVSFYILPVVFESKFVTLGKTVEGYFDYVNHFVTLNQLLISRFWSYGGSTWGLNDGMSLSVGHIQWTLPLLTLPFILLKRQWKKYSSFLVLLVLGWMMLWLTHNKSTFLWNILTPLQYLQFPWRFLGLSVFSFALASGIGILFIKRFLFRAAVTLTVISLLIALNAGFFFEDLWFPITDKEQFNGFRYEQQLIPSSISDYWPIYGSKFPTSKAQRNTIFIKGEGTGLLLEKKSDIVTYKLNVNSENAEIQAPVVYFPGWVAYINNERIKVYPSGELGLITTTVPKGEYKLSLRFENTPVRVVGNTISAITIVVIGVTAFLIRKKKV